MEKIEEINNQLLAFLEDPSNISIEDEQIIQIIDADYIKENKEKLECFLRMVVDISNNHKRQPRFFEKINAILFYLKDEIKQTFSNIEIYDISKSNKLVLLFLITEQILSLDDEIAALIKEKREPNGIRYSDFFIPELKKFENEDEKENDQNLIEMEKYEFYRQQGENESYICSLIRNDLIEEFISYVHKNSISLSSLIKHSIFETNSFLNQHDTSLIEYASFFGSIQIFQYLSLNKVVLPKSIWIYGIHSNNSEFLRHYIEESNITPEDETYEECVKESIKCHHNDFAEFFKNNLVSENSFQNESKILFEERLIITSFTYHNFIYIADNYDNSYVFFCLCKYNYKTIVNDLYKSHEDEINNIIRNI